MDEVESNTIVSVYAKDLDHALVYFFFYSGNWSDSKIN